MKTNFLLIFVVFITISCSPSYNDLMSRRKYPEAFELIYDTILENPKTLQNHQENLITSFEFSIEKDRHVILSELKKYATDFYKYQEILAGIEEKINKIESLFAWPNMVPESVSAVHQDIDRLKSLVSEKAFDYYYKNYSSWLSEIKSGDKTNARKAWEMIDGMKFFAPEKYKYEELYTELKKLGTIYTLIITTNQSGFNYNPLHEFDYSKINSQLMVYHDDPEKYDYDRILEFFIEEIDPGYDRISVSGRTVSKEIKVGERQEEVEVEVPQPCKPETVTVTECDSTFTKVICQPQPPLKKKEMKMVPIFETVHATIEDHCLSKNANAYITVFLEDINSNHLLYKKESTVSYDYTEKQTMYHGDQRALDFYCSNSVYLSSPSDGMMIERLKDEIRSWTKHQLDKIKKY